VRRVAYFTAGSHGAGHLVRGLALERALRRAGAAVELRLFGPPSPFAHVAGDLHEAVRVDVEELRVPSRARASALARALAAFEPELLVVDLFWVPLAFVPLPCPAWLLLRSVPPWWLVGPKEARFDAARFERVFAIEPAPGLERFEALPPVVVANREEARSRDALCALLGADPTRALHLVAHAGLPTDAATLTALAPAPGAQVRRVDLSEPGAPFPLAPWLVGLGPEDVVVAAPGYNAFWEARWLGYAPRARWVPIARTLDDAAWRARCAPPAGWMENGADVLARQLVARLGGR
jgi:hypothetical protein